jgi:hypothetical protein
MLRLWSGMIVLPTLAACSSGSPFADADADVPGEAVDGDAGDGAAPDDTADDEADGAEEADGEADGGPEDPLWVVPFGGTLDDYGMGVEAGPAGNVVVCGYYGSALDFAGTTLPFAGALDAFAATFDPTGVLRWVRTVGGPGEERETGVAVDASGAVVLATEYSAPLEVDGLAVTHFGATDLLLVEYSAAGAVVWVRSFGGTATELQPRVAFGPTGDLYFTAMFEGTVDFGGTPLTAADARDIVVARLSSVDGSTVWARAFGGGADDSAYGIAVDASENVTLTGWFGNSIDFGGGMLSPGGAFVARLAGTDGSHVWSRAPVGGGNVSGCGLALDASGGAFVTGWFQDTLDPGGGPLTAVDFTDLWLASYDAAGGHRWSRAFGGPSVDSSCAAAVTRDGDVVFGGFFNNTIDLGGGPLVAVAPSDGFLARQAGGDGASVWAIGLGGAGGDHVSDLAVDDGDAVLVTGDYSAAFEFLGVPVPVVGASDGFVAHVPARVLAGAAP